MAEPRPEVVKLYRRWQQGGGNSPEEICKNHPELLEELKVLIKRVAKAQAAKAPKQAEPAQTVSLPRDTAPQFQAVQIDGYQLLNEISRGGQAVVYAGIFQKTGRKVAIKVMREGPLATESSRARFNREVQILAALNHPNIVNVLDRGRTADGSEFFVMDYIQGHSLDTTLWKTPAKVAAGPNENPSRPLLMFLKICDAVNAAHLRGIVHRDLKPSNIRVDERDEPHVLDFGLARGTFLPGERASSGDPVTLTGQFLGSLPWSSPEQAEGTPDKIDTRSDVYSLGVILYQIVTGGQFPYQVAGSMRDVLNNIITAEPPPPSTVLAAREAKDLQRQVRRSGHLKKLVNPLLDAIVLRALSKRRDDRYQNAGDLARDIENYLAGKPTMASDRVAKSSNQYLFLGSAAAAVLLMAGALIYFSWSGKGNTTPRPGLPPVVAVPDPTADSRSGLAAVAPLAPASASAPATLAGGPESSPFAAEYKQLDRLVNAGDSYEESSEFIKTQAVAGFANWKFAADQNDAVAQFLVGRSMEEGIPGPKDEAGGKTWISKAADQHLPLAMGLQGWRYAYGTGVLKDFGEARRWYRQAADAGESLAMAQMGWLCQMGYGFPTKDPAEAMKWYRKAADAGSSVGMWRMGQMNYLGEGMPKDELEAMKWYRQAADTGLSAAMFDVGMLYSKGEGTKQDRTEAMAWMKKAADAGNGEAQKWLQDDAVQVATAPAGSAAVAAASTSPVSEAGPTLPGVDLKKGLVLYFSLKTPPANGIVRDESNSDNAGNVIGATWITDGQGHGAYSFHFTNPADATNVITVPHKPGFRIDQFTLAAWINTYFVSPGWIRIIDKDFETGYALSVAGGNFGKAPANRGKLELEMGSNSIFSDQAVNDGIWHHVVGTYDGQEQKLYVDGKIQKNIRSRTVIARVNDSDLRIGNGVNKSTLSNGALENLAFCGAIDEVRIYDRALTPAEVVALRDVGGPGVAGRRLGMAAPGQVKENPLKFGLYLHFGLATFGGVKAPITGYNPPPVIDCSQWVALAKQMGMNFAILTAKHESGFCLWHSEGYDFDVASSPVKMDVVAKFIMACKASGIVPGLHYSIPDARIEGSVKYGSLVAPAYYALIKRQIKELVTKYPDTRIWILDGASKLSPQQFIELREIIKGSNSQYVVVPNDIGFPPVFVEETVNKGWMWSATAAITPVDTLFEQYSLSKTRDLPYIVNVGVDRTGHVPKEYVKILGDLKKMIDGG